MAKMIIMKGLPGSGKSTRARELMEQHGNFVRINKDLLRTMLHFDVFSGKKEEQTRDAAREIAKFFLTKNNMNVIIDDTNLNPGTMQSWKDLAKECDARVEVVDMTDVSVRSCIFWDTQREKIVGETVIKNMAMRYGLIKYTPQSVVLCDLDGTIADITHRLHYIKAPDGKKDWKGFFSGIPLDTVRQDVREILLDFYNKGHTIIFLSARPDTYKKETLMWLEKNCLTFAFTLIMREARDKRPDTEVKKDMLDRYFPDRSVIHTIIDDRPSVIRMWREEGLSVMDVGEGKEF